jgi:two-component system sensor histidine kinase PilS (NtrC family)
MSTPAEAPPDAQTDLARRLIGLVNLYRLLIPPVLLAILYWTRPVPTLGGQQPQLFAVICALYWVLGFLIAFAARGHWPGRHSLVLTHTLVDAGAIGMLLYAGGGIASGLGILLFIPVGALSLLAEGRDVLLVPAIATVAVLAQQVTVQLLGFAPATDDLLAGVMGALLFIVALLVWPVSNRLHESEALVRRQELDLANLAQLSQYILQHLRESILVIDPSDRIRLINDSAAQLLGSGVALPGALIGEVSPRLLYLLSTWRGQQLRNSGDDETFVAADGARIIRPHFASLGATSTAGGTSAAVAASSAGGTSAVGAAPSPVIAFLEDTTVIAEKVQQSKLAALGRLSASIAHEIRNPVGAMSHAAQLLAESTAIRDEDRRLTEIMQSNSLRVSTIIDNVLQLSRREPPHPEEFGLAAWTEEFREEFCATAQLPLGSLLIAPKSDDVEVRADPSQLHQIVWNLCQNALTHGLRNRERDPNQPGIIEIQYGRLPGVSRPYLQVADRGPGIGIADAERIFEPFFTRAQRGTGLGLFLARELAQANGATLRYAPRDGGGAIFRIVFADPSRWINVTATGRLPQL